MPAVSEELLSRIADVVAIYLGLSFPRERWDALEMSFIAAAEELGFSNPESCLDFLFSDKRPEKYIETLAKHLTVGESYFFRDSRLFEVLEKKIFPEMISSLRETTKQLKIVSAGCSSGEEPYSIAILLHKLLPDIKKWQILIEGIDINPLSIEKARTGIYRKWDFRDTPEWVISNYFTKVNEGWKILSDIQKLVSFSVKNLAGENLNKIFSDAQDIDIIICRNMLMYFVGERSERLVDSFYRALREGGWLIVSPCELSTTLFSRFTVVEFPGVILYQKRDSSQVVTIQESFSDLSDLLPDINLCGHEEIKASMTLEKSEALTQPTVSLAQIQKDDDSILVMHKLQPVEGAAYIQMDEEDALFSLSRALANEGKLEDSLALCDKALSINKLNVSFYYLRANILEELSRPDEAFTSLERALYLDHDFVLCYVALGNLFRRQGKRKQTEKYFATALLLLQNQEDGALLPHGEGVTAGEIKMALTAILERGKQDAG